MNAMNKSKINKISIIVLTLAVFICLGPILILYSDFLTFPPILETTEDIKNAVGFFYAPLLMAVLAFSSLILRFHAGSGKLPQYCAWLGLFLSSGLIAWWLTFENGFLPTIFLPIFFLQVVINDIKERKSHNETLTGAGSDLNN